MRITQNGSRYTAESRFEEKDLLKKAGFRWDPTSKRWYTDDVRVASKLAYAADASIKPALETLALELETSKLASRATNANVEIPAPEGLSYLPFQKAGIAFASDKKNVLIGDDMGLGKTIQAIGIINLNASIKSIVVVCPASLKLNWKRELNKWLVAPLTVAIAKSGEAWPTANVVIVNYDILHKFTANLSQPHDMAIVDECHYVKNDKARRSKMTYAINAERHVFMSGTPIVNRPVELFPIIHHLDPIQFPKFGAYAFRYCAPVNNGYGWDFKGASNLDELQDKLRSTLLVRRLKADVLTDLPAKRRQIIELDTNGFASLIARERAVAEKVFGTVEGFRNAVQTLTTPDVPHFSELSAIRHEIAKAKIPAVIEHLESAIESGKVIVFAHHHDVIEALRDHFGDAAVVLYGSTSQENRDKAVTAFQTDDKVRLFIGSITAAGVGITLTASAHVVFAELDWVSGNVTQAEDRAHRIGQRESVLIQHLVVDGSLDSLLAKTIVAKQTVIEKALDIETKDVLADLRAKAEAEIARKTAENIAAEGAAKTAAQERKARELAEVPAEFRALVLKGLQILAGLDPDRALYQNGIGFNGLDAQFGHDLANNQSLTARQAVAGARMIRKYKRQLPEEVNAAIKAFFDKAK